LATLSFDQLESEISQGKFSPVYLLSGKEELLVRNAVAMVKDKAVAAEFRDFNFISLSGRDCSGARIASEANTFPMMSPRRLVLVTELNELEAAELEVVAAYAASPQIRTVLVLVADEIDRRTSFYRRMNEFACIVDCAKLKGPALERWAESQIVGKGYRIAAPALRKFVDLAGSDLLTLSAEIEKLILYAGKEKQIPDTAIDKLVAASRQHSVFELTGAIGKKDPKAALKLLGNLLESGEAPLMILSMLARHFRQVIIAQELLSSGRPPREIARRAQIPEWLVGEFLRQAQAIDGLAARKLHRSLAEMDSKFKSGGPVERVLLERLICSL
jgi:DNA polymerase III subunit delta